LKTAKKWEDDTKIDFIEFGCEGKGWIELVEAAQWRSEVLAALNLRIL
jgi:hypothetical protein